MLQIPLKPIPGQTFNITLEGRPCVLSLYWRQERLYLDLEAGRRQICRGAVCQNRAEIIQGRTPDFSGGLRFYDLEGDRPPHWKELHDGAGGRHVLLYLEEGENLPDELRY